MTEITNEIELPYDGPVLMTLTHRVAEGKVEHISRHADLVLLISPTAKAGTYDVVLGHAIGDALLKGSGLYHAHLAVPSGGMLQGRVESVDPKGRQFVLVAEAPAGAV